MRIRLPKNTLARREATEGLLGISPWLIGFLLFTAGPFVVSIVLSMTDWRIMIAPKFVGLQNYIQILTNDPNFWQSIRVTFTYVALALPLGLFAGLGLSLLLNQKVPGARAFGTLFYLPAVLSGVSVALMWMWLLNPDYGVVNTMLGLIGIQGPNWFWDPDWALPSVVLMSLWRVGGSAIIYLAGLQNISPHLYEAAEIDGAGRLAKLRHITIPMLTPTIFFQLVMELIDAFQVFTVIYVITDGGPMRSTLFYMFYMFRTAFEDFDMGYASALAWIMGVIILGFTALVFKSSPLWVFYESDVKQ
ncbi:MAG: sugar ABC transporter permease [Thermoflexales bacterium]|nr:sugar ABC transporter permease [Thermoflexales bacterium]